MYKKVQKHNTYPAVRHLILVTALVLLPFHLAAQQEISRDDLFLKEESRKGKFYLIPEASLWFGNYTNVSLSPQIAYHPLDRLSVGVGPHYIFYQNNDFYSPINFSSHIWGVKGFTRLSVIRNAAEMLPFYLFDELFAHFEYELMNMENRYFNAPTYPDEGRFWAESIYVGFGINQNFGGFSSYSIMLLWDLNNNMVALYRNPTYRIGLNIYF